MTEYELYHHGIKGQKWGVRRTAAQLGHRVASAAKNAGKATGKFVKKEAGIAKKAAITKAKQTHADNKEKRYYKKLHKKRLSQMTDKEIKDLTKRVKEEASLKDAKYESRAQNARKFYKDVAQQPLNTFLATYSKKAVDSMFKDDKSDDNDNSNSGGNSNKNKNKNKNNQNQTFTIETEVDSGGYDDDNKKKKNPVIIRHGR